MSVLEMRVSQNGGVTKALRDTFRTVIRSEEGIGEACHIRFRGLKPVNEHFRE